MSRFEEVRALLQRPPSTNVWFDLCEIADQIHERDHEDIIPYVSAYLSRWPNTIIRPLALPWTLTGEAQHWLVPFSNQINVYAHALAMDGPVMSTLIAQGIEPIQTIPLSDADQLALALELLRAPDLGEEAALDDDEGTFEDQDLAMEMFHMYFPVLASHFDPIKFRTVTKHNLDEAVIEVTEFMRLAKRCGAIFQLQRLADMRTRVLDFSNAQIKQFNENALIFRNARVLDLSCNNLRDLPGGLSQLYRLSQLDMSYNRFRTIPECLHRLAPRLQFLDATETNIPHHELRRFGQANPRLRLVY